VRVGAQVVVVSIVLAALTYLVGWLHLRGADGGMEDLGTAIGYGLLIVGFAIVAAFGVLLMFAGWIASTVRGRRQVN
jgi:hypothetical protein